MIRPISSLYLVGQLHPRQPVPRPTVDFKFDHAHKRVSVWLQRHLNQVPDGPEGRDQRYAVSVDMLAQVILFYFSMSCAIVSLFVDDIF